MSELVIILYFLALSFILAYSLVQLYLIFQYQKFRKHDRNSNNVEVEELPHLTVQLPVYNEKYVVERLLDSVAGMDYPEAKLEIQLLDDSTDECREIAANKVAELQRKGIDIVHIHREERSGFKAGALAEGTLLAKGELIAIFDADFVPPSNFLMRLVPEFSNPRIGMVQSRWGHLNRNYSWLTNLQAFGLDAHFSIEQGGRNAGGHFINFNGTAGIWRKQCILDAGGWEADTLTEDLDLSYRAQLKGWKFLFRQDVESPAELPAEMNALKNQQYRWNKGAAECMRKNLPKVLNSKALPISTKVNAIFHLMNSAIFICVILLSVLSIPLMAIKQMHPEWKILFSLGSVFLICLPILAAFYWYSERNRKSGNSGIRFFIRFPAFLSVSMGLSLHNAIAVLEGYLGKKTPFIRTPKFNLKDRNDHWIRNVYLDRKLSPLLFWECLLAIYFLGGTILAFRIGDFGLLPFHLMLFSGFAYVAFVSLWHSLKLSQ